MNHRPERPISIKSLPKKVRAGFNRRVPGAEPVQVDWQRLGTGLEIYEIEYIDETGETKEEVLGCDGLPLSREEIVEHGRRVAS